MLKLTTFPTHGKNGLAFCALIHRHRPDLIDFDSLDKSNARSNLELAFSVAEEKLGIPRLLDPEDLCDVAKPDERSVMTYVSEYFHCFASQNVREKSAHRIQKFVEFQKSMEDMEASYENQANDLLIWIENTIEILNDRSFDSNSYESAKQLFEAYKRYLATEKPPKNGLKLDIEALYANIQTKLAVNGRTAYSEPSNLSTSALDAAWDRLEQAEKARGQAVRDNLFKFVTRTVTAVSDDQMKEFEASFNHFDKDRNGSLDRLEFKAALSALGIPFRDDEAFDKVFFQVSGGAERITKDQFIAYLIGLSEDKDTADSIRSAFQHLADNADRISHVQLRTHPLQDNVEVEYLAHRMPALDNQVYDYNSYLNSAFKN